jgi:hypothetical protein
MAIQERGLVFGVRHSDPGHSVTTEFSPASNGNFFPDIDRQIRENEGLKTEIDAIRAGFLDYLEQGASKGIASMFERNVGQAGKSSVEKRYQARFRLGESEYAINTSWGRNRLERSVRIVLPDKHFLDIHQGRAFFVTRQNEFFRQVNGEDLEGMSRLLNQINEGFRQNPARW